MKAKKIAMMLLVCILSIQTSANAITDTTTNNKIQIKISKQKATPERNFTLSPYWESYNDSLLNSYIDEALENNLSIKIAKSRIKQSQAILGTVTAERLPQLSINPSIY